MIRALFIGVDRYSDPGIRDLGGAARDALALWSLFTDTIDTIAATKLIDNDATVSAITAALEEHLGQASEDDLVVVSFSGHGTHDHRLVAHDTQKLDIQGTTIPMEELARLFRETKARAVLCIIDCCFSGGAPARVVEDSPISRDPGIPFEKLAGKGRIIIAAANVDELAYESPNTRHGLLTGALIEAMTADGATLIDVTAAMARVMELVRAAAASIGVVQTPVLFGHVEGGFVLPRLQIGDRYRAAFPEAVGTRVSSAIDDLAAFGVPQAVLREWQDRFRGGLNELQLAAVNDYRILDGASLLVIAPTSAGKTFVGELAATRAIVEGRKAVFLLPYRALVNEKFDLFTSIYGDRLGMRVVRCSGDFADQVDTFVRGKYDIALLTYEMFLNIAVANTGILHQIGLVVIDEAQFIADPNRGITVELLLTFLLTARSRGVAPQLICLSAVIGDVNAFDEWLACRSLVTTKRPVPLIEGVMDRGGIFQYLDVDGSTKREQLLTTYDIQQRRDKPSAQDMIVPLVRKLVRGTNEKVLVFRNMRGPAEGCAKYLAAEMGLSAADDALSALPAGDQSTASADLRTCLLGGTAFHNSNLSREEKQAIERSYRDPNSNLRVLAATTTVAAGINTPASTAIIAEQEFVGEDGRPFTVAEYKNMAGRAGRLGFNESGRAIILANDPSEREYLFRRYITGALGTLTSSFSLENLDTWIVRLLAQVKAVPKQDVVQLLVNTYGGYVENRRQPGWREMMEARLTALLETMLRLGLLETEQELVRLTLLGRACGESSLSFGSALRLVELLRGAGGHVVDAVSLLLLVQALPESAGGFTPMFKKGQKEAVRPAEAAARFGSALVQLLQRYAEDTFDYYARCKRAAILKDWIDGRPVDEIEHAYTVTPYQGKIGYGDIRRFADATRFHLRAAARIVEVVFPEVGMAGGQVDELLRRLEIGLPADTLDLLMLPISLHRGDYLKLRQMGIRSRADFWAMKDAEMTAALGTDQAQALIAKRP